MDSEGGNKFPSLEKALADAVDAAGPMLDPILFSMSEYLIICLNEPISQDPNHLGVEVDGDSVSMRGIFL